MDDHLDKETSLSVSITESSVTAKARSRFVAAIDRLAGNAAEVLNVRLEEGISKRRTKMEAERQLVEATAKYGVERIARDEVFAERAFENHFRKIANAQLNKDGVLREAVEDLRRDPPSAAEASHGPEEIDEAFMNRFEFYAEGASSDEVRHRWGRVLASEVRKPGTFSAKILRVVDELPPETAALFETLCRDQLGGILPKELVGELSFQDKARLTTAGLLIEPGLGQQANFVPVRADDGKEYILCPFDRHGLVLPMLNESISAGHFKGGPKSRMSVYVLTSDGRAISSILPDNQDKAFSKLMESFERLLPNIAVARAEKTREGNWVITPT